MWAEAKSASAFLFTAPAGFPALEHSSRAFGSREVMLRAQRSPRPSGRAIFHHLKITGLEAFQQLALFLFPTR